MGSERGPRILDESLGFFHRREVPAARHRHPALEVVALLRPASGKERDILREDRHRRGRANDRCGFVARRLWVVQALVVIACRRAIRLGRPVDRHRRTQAILGKSCVDVAVEIAPCPALLENPRAQAHRRIVQAVRDRLRAGALNRGISAAIGEEGFIALEVVAFGFIVVAFSSGVVCGRCAASVARVR